MLKSWAEAKLRFKSTSRFGWEKRFECHCGKKVRYVAKIDAKTIVCKDCYEDWRKAHAESSSN